MRNKALQNGILFVLWIIVGLIVLFSDKEITKLQYGLAWGLLVLHYLIDWLESIAAKPKNSH